MKLTKKQLSDMIMETLLEMIEDGDEGLINLMRESERLNGEIEEDLNEWVSQTKSVLQESLGIDEGAELEAGEDSDVDMLTEGHIEMLRLSGALNEGADKDAAWELGLYIQNNERIYRQRILPIIKNLARKMVKGQYDDKKAIKAWYYAAEDGAKAYHSEFGSGGKWSDMFSKATRMATAEELRDIFFGDVEDMADELGMPK